MEGNIQSFAKKEMENGGQLVEPGVIDKESESSRGCASKYRQAISSL